MVFTASNDQIVHAKTPVYNFAIAVYIRTGQAVPGVVYLN